VARHTVLGQWHRRHGANPAEFAGYEMPLWYPAGARAEHLAVLAAVGVFDTSHMAVLRVSGPGAFGLLQHCHTRDLGALLPVGDPPRCTYGVFLDARGHVVDDAVVYGLSPDRFLVVVNAGMGPRVAAHLTAHAPGPGAVVEDLTDRLGKIDVQGPGAARLLEPLLADPDRAFRDLGWFRFRGHFDPRAPEAGQVQWRDGTPVLLSRTGYTGEFGFELYVEAHRAPAIWADLVEAGEGRGLLPCGLAARDSLRTGAVLPLAHQDLGGRPFVRNPWTHALPLGPGGTGYTKEFLGRAALEAAEDAAWTLPFAGFDPRKVPSGASVRSESGRALGTVLTCTTDMGIDRVEGRIVSVASPDRPAGFTPRGLCCGFVRVDEPLPPGARVELCHGRRSIPVEIVSDIRPDRTARLPIAAMRTRPSSAPSPEEPP